MGVGNRGAESSLPCSYRSQRKGELCCCWLRLVFIPAHFVHKAPTRFTVFPAAPSFKSIFSSAAKDRPETNTHTHTHARPSRDIDSFRKLGGLEIEREETSRRIRMSTRATFCCQQIPAALDLSDMKTALRWGLSY